MSSGLKLDRADTASAEKAHEVSLKIRNWLRHGKGSTAGKIDEMLLNGATIAHGQGRKDDKSYRIRPSDTFEEGAQVGHCEEGWGAQV